MTTQSDKSSHTENRAHRRAAQPISKGKGAPSDDFPIRAYKTREKDGSVDLFDGRLVNRQRMAEMLKCPLTRISAMMNMPNGLPHIRIGARYWFDPEAVLAWFKEKQTQANPDRKRRHS